MATIIGTFFKSLGFASIIYFVQAMLEVNFVAEFMSTNLLGLLVTLMAINTATTAFIVSKMQEISRDNQKSINEVFGNTKAQLLLSVQEQLSLIVSALILSMLAKKNDWTWKPELIGAGIEILLLTTFIYSLFILYDTAKAVLEFHE